MQENRKIIINKNDNFFMEAFRNRLLN